jgi:hypothetical protein
MKQRLFVALTSVLFFMAGIVGGMWIERHRPLPPPPLGLGSEFFHGKPGSDYFPGRNHPFDRAELIARVQSIQPQLEAFQAQMKQIDAEFDREIDPVLTPEQRTQRAEHLKRHASGNQWPKENGPRLTDAEIIDLLRERPARTILWDVVIPFRLDFLVREYHLDDAQREKVRTLLKERRDKILELVDRSPPPSVMLGRLAPLMQRLR